MNVFYDIANLQNFFFFKKALNIKKDKSQRFKNVKCQKLAI